MATLVLTAVGDDRAGLVQALAETVSAHGGNWQTSELAELAGAFAGIILVAVPDERVEELTTALRQLDGLLRVTLHAGAASSTRGEGRVLTFGVLGNDRPGIVREISGVVTRHGLTIELFSSQTRDAPMSGGTLFDAEITARGSVDADVAGVIADLERLAGEIQVDISVTDR